MDGKEGKSFRIQFSTSFAQLNNFLTQMCVLKVMYGSGNYM